MKKEIVIVLVIIAFISGCGKYALKNPDHPKMYSLEQTYKLNEIRKRMHKVKRGMNQKEVIKVLGKPSMVCNNGWSYLFINDEGTPVIKTKEGEVQIRFENGIVKYIDDIKNTENLYGVGGK